VIPSASERFGQWVKRLGGALAITGAIVVGVFWIGAEGLVNRAAQTIDSVKTSADQQNTFFSRPEIWKDTWALVRANAFFGIGLGAYKAVFPQYARHDGMYVVDYAHNDYLQILSDGGIIGGALALCFLLLLGRTIWRALQAADPLEAGLALGAGAGLVALLVHSVFDFNLQIPSNALLFVFLSSVVWYIASNAGVSKPAGVVVRPLPMEATHLLGQ
jgi:O-antigen ligase